MTVASKMRPGRREEPSYEGPRSNIQLELDIVGPTARICLRTVDKILSFSCRRTWKGPGQMAGELALIAVGPRLIMVGLGLAAECLTEPAGRGIHPARLLHVSARLCRRHWLRYDKSYRRSVPVGDDHAVYIAVSIASWSLSQLVNDWPARP